MVGRTALPSISDVGTSVVQKGFRLKVRTSVKLKVSGVTTGAPRGVSRRRLTGNSLDGVPPVGEGTEGFTRLSEFYRSMEIFDQAVAFGSGEKSQGEATSWGPSLGTEGSRGARTRGLAPLGGGRVVLLLEFEGILGKVSTREKGGKGTFAEVSLSPGALPALRALSDVFGLAILADPRRPVQAELSALLSGSGAQIFALPRSGESLFFSLEGLSAAFPRLSSLIFVRALSVESRAAPPPLEIAELLAWRLPMPPRGCKLRVLAVPSLRGEEPRADLPSKLKALAQRPKTEHKVPFSANILSDIVELRQLALFNKLKDSALVEPKKFDWEAFKAKVSKSLNPRFKSKNKEFFSHFKPLVLANHEARIPFNTEIMIEKSKQAAILEAQSLQLFFNAIQILY